MRVAFVRREACLDVAFRQGGVDLARPVGRVGRNDAGRVAERFRHGVQPLRHATESCSSPVTISTSTMTPVASSTTECCLQAGWSRCFFEFVAIVASGPFRDLAVLVLDPCARNAHGLRAEGSNELARAMAVTAPFRPLPRPQLQRPKKAARSSPNSASMVARISCRKPILDRIKASVAAR